MKAVLIITPKHFSKILQKDIKKCCDNKEIDGISYSVAPFLGIGASGTSTSINIESESDLFNSNQEITLDVLSSVLEGNIKFSKDKLYCYSKNETIKSTLVITDE